MTPNNLHGHTKNIKWGEIYKEKLSANYYLVVTLSKEYSSENFPHVCIQCAVTTGKMHQYSNGVVSYKETDLYWYKKENAPDLLELTTKDGYICKQFIAQETGDMVRYEWKTDITPDYLLTLISGSA